MALVRRRPVFLTLWLIRMPVGAVTSILHRISGVFLLAALPFGVYLLDVSSASPEGYAQVSSLLDRWPLRVATVLFAWALSHHALAGVRHLLSDVDVGSRLPAARRSAWLANMVALFLALLTAWILR
jgi:succinate dehydrogenase / fumarate reductase cytochrome b subunit